jgi:hypothetical protein
MLVLTELILFIGCDINPMNEENIMHTALKILKKTLIGAGVG